MHEERSILEIIFHRKFLLNMTCVELFPNPVTRWKCTLSTIMWNRFKHLSNTSSFDESFFISRILSMRCEVWIWTESGLISVIYGHKQKCHNITNIQWNTNTVTWPGENSSWQAVISTPSYQDWNWSWNQRGELTLLHRRICSHWKKHPGRAVALPDCQLVALSNVFTITQKAFKS